jgi:uncharacterized protein involved in type VI secretion and phage assembly
VGIFSEIGAMQQNVTTANQTFSIEIAEVTDVKDPGKMNRVKCKILTRDKKGRESNWALVSSFMAGNKAGATFFPSKGDMVLLAYIGGDPNRPVVLGGIWTDKSERPYKYDADGKNPIRSIKTAGGAEIIIDDTKDKEKISVTTKAGSMVLLDDGKKEISITDKGKKNSIKIALKNGEMTLAAEKKIVLKAGSAAKLELDGTGGKLVAEGKNSTSIKSAKIEAKATGQLDISGSVTNVKSSGMLVLKGSMVKIN